MTHQAPGGSAALRCTLDYPDLDGFVRGYGRNLSAGGLFIPTREPPAVGTLLRFELRLRRGGTILRGEGTVTQKLGEGVAVRCSRLDAAGRAVLEKALAYKAAHPADYFEAVADPYATTAPAAEPAPASTSSGPKPPSAASQPRGKGEAALAELLSPTPAAQTSSQDDLSKLLEARLSRRRTT